MKNYILLLLAINCLISCISSVDEPETLIVSSETEFASISDVSKIKTIHEILSDSMLRSKITWYNYGLMLSLEDQDHFIIGVETDINEPLTSLQSWKGGPFGMLGPIYPDSISNDQILKIESDIDRRLDLFHEYLDMIKADN